jgi:O-antigen/teichoic acid export membrane protein
MDSGTKKRLALGFLSGIFNRLAGSVIQLIQVPVLLHFWGLSRYGEWLILSGIPVYLSFSSIGFGNVAGNEMSMLVAAGDRAGALRVFQSCWWMISLVCGVTVCVMCGGLYLLPVAHLLKLTALSDGDTKWIIFYLGTSVLLGQLEHLLQSAYRCVGRYPFGSFLESATTLGAFLCMVATVALGGAERRTALVFSVANVAGTALLAGFVRRDIPWIEFGWRHARFAEIKRLAGPAFAFMGFPIGNALNLQGTLMAVQYAMGPASVGVFGTARTVSRFALQMVQMVNTTFWPEMSVAFGQKNAELTRTLHRRACQMALIIAAVVVTGMMTVGPWFLSHWTGGHVQPSRGLLSLLLLVVVFYALWSTSSTLLAAINQHQRLAAWYIFATSITCLLCYVLARRYGLYGAAASLLVSELVMNVYVLPASLKIAHDSFGEFMASMAHLPDSLNWEAMLSRLRKSKPELES